jgi:hypothetical protein
MNLLTPSTNTVSFYLVKECKLEGVGTREDKQEEGMGGIWRDMEGYGGIWKDMEGYEERDRWDVGIRIGRDREGYGRRDVEG